MRILGVVTIAIALTGPAFAGEGVLEINQTCATATGCFAGDTAGFPVTIATLGSYRLTGNLVLPNETTSGILVTASDVRIDLGGFTIRGPNQCSAPPAGCTLSGVGFGIHAQADRLSVADGKIVGMGSVGIYGETGDGHEIRNLTVAHNRFQGIRIDGAAATVEDVKALRNGAEGISVGLIARVARSTAFQNGGNGISESGGSTVSDVTASENGDAGIFAGSGSTLSGNTAKDNAGVGIRASVGSAIQRNTLQHNLIGLSLQNLSTYRENTMTLNTVQQVIGQGVNTGDNSCNGLSCPF